MISPDPAVLRDWAQNGISTFMDQDKCIGDQVQSC